MEVSDGRFAILQRFLGKSTSDKCFMEEKAIKEKRRKATANFIIIILSQQITLVWSSIFHVSEFEATTSTRNPLKYFFYSTFSPSDKQFCFLIQQSSCQNKHYFFMYLMLKEGKAAGGSFCKSLLSIFSDYSSSILSSIFSVSPLPTPFVQLLFLQWLSHISVGHIYVKIYMQ